MNRNIMEERFLRINKKFGLLVGLWPGPSSFGKTFKRVIIMVILLLGYYAQVARLVLFCNFDTFLNDAPYLAVSVETLTKTGNYIINESKLKLLLNGISEDWLAIKSVNEFKIMLKYGKRGYFISMLYMIHMTICTAAFFSMQFIPVMLDVVLPLNKSRDPIYAYPVYYSFDNEKYHFIVVVHMSIMLILTNVLYCASDMNYVYVVQHACGLFAVTGYRFKYACYNEHTDDGKETDQTRIRRIYRNVCDSIRTHQRAIQYLNAIQSSYSTCIFISMGLVTACISSSLLLMTSSEFGVMWMIYILFLLTQFLHVFFLVVQGQFVINSQDVLYKTIWESTWYDATNKTKALYVLALRRTLISPLLTAGGFVKLDLKTFTEIIKASVSYYTVMKSK